MAGSYSMKLACIASLAALMLSPGAQADEIADFYHGKTVSILVGTSAGNDYDLRARLIGKYLAKTLPGQPTIVVRNMPGAGGITGVKYDTREFAFIGKSTNAPNVMAAWHATGIKTWDDLKARKAIVGAPMGTSGATYAEAMNALLGTKLNIVTGYPGGVEVNLAMERGEVEVRASNSWASWKATSGDWIADKKINFIMQVGLQRHPDLKDVPLLLELAQTDEARDILRFLSAETAISRTMVLAPGAPKERIQALRRAYDAVMVDPAFLADADRAKMDVSAMKGEDAQVIADAIVNTSQQTIARARALLGDLLN